MNGTLWKGFWSRAFLAAGICLCVLREEMPGNRWRWQPALRPSCSSLAWGELRNLGAQEGLTHGWGCLCPSPAGTPSSGAQPWPPQRAPT